MPYGHARRKRAKNYLLFSTFFSLQHCYLTVLGGLLQTSPIIFPKREGHNNLASKTADSAFCSRPPQVARKTQGSKPRWVEKISMVIDWYEGLNLSFEANKTMKKTKQLHYTANRRIFQIWTGCLYLHLFYFIY